MSFEKGMILSGVIGGIVGVILLIFGVILGNFSLVILGLCVVGSGIIGEIILGCLSVKYDSLISSVIINPEDEREAREFTQTGGRNKSNWFYQYTGDNPMVDSYGSGSGGHGNRCWQFDCYHDECFWFTQYEFSKFPYTEESLKEAFENGELVPEGAAPTDLNILRDVEGRP